MAVILVLLVLLITPAVGVGQDVDGIDNVLVRLESNVSSLKTLSASFVQKKKMAAFSHEIKMGGKVYIRKPSTLAWHVMDPLRYSVLITDKLVRQWDEETDEIHEISLSGNPMLGAVLEQMTVWFSGKYTSLSKDYEISVASAKGSPVVLEFIPREGNMAGKVISSVRVGLARDERYLSWIRIEESGGDTTTIEFSETVFDSPLPEKNFEVKGSV
jgi:outer membrane lipoprotein-sorting protein